MNSLGTLNLKNGLRLEVLLIKGKIEVHCVAFFNFSFHLNINLLIKTISMLHSNKPNHQYDVDKQQYLSRCSMNQNYINSQGVEAKPMTIITKSNPHVLIALVNVYFYEGVMVWNLGSGCSGSMLNNHLI